MPIHIGDYKRDTGHLRAAEHGAYLMLLFHYWSTGALPDDDRQLSAIACMSPAEWKRTRPLIVKFFDDGWKHGRVDYELEKASNISAAARLAGKASGRSRSAKPPLNDRSPPVEPTLEPLNHLKKEEDTANAVSSYAFEDGLIKLNQRDFDNWSKAYGYLELSAELLSLSEWAKSQGKNWFHAVKGALAKRNREVKAAKEKQQQEPFKWNGIEGVV